MRGGALGGPVADEGLAAYVMGHEDLGAPPRTARPDGEGILPLHALTPAYPPLRPTAVLHLLPLLNTLIHQGHLDCHIKERQRHNAGTTARDGKGASRLAG